MVWERGTTGQIRRRWRLALPGSRALFFISRLRPRSVLDLTPNWDTLGMYLNFGVGQVRHSNPIDWVDFRHPWAASRGGTRRPSRVRSYHSCRGCWCAGNLGSVAVIGAHCRREGKYRQRWLGVRASTNDGCGGRSNRYIRDPQSWGIGSKSRRSGAPYSD